MNTFTLVRSEHLNHHGYLFGGQLLKWVDENAWLVATRDNPGYALVTRAMDKVEFKTRVPNGSILRFDIKPYNKGKSSVSYTVNVFADAPGFSEELLVFSNHVTFVSVDDNGNKRNILDKQKYKSSNDDD